MNEIMQPGVSFPKPEWKCKEEGKPAAQEPTCQDVDTLVINALGTGRRSPEAPWEHITGGGRTASFSKTEAQRDALMERKEDLEDTLEIVGCPCEAEVRTGKPGRDIRPRPPAFCTCWPCLQKAWVNGNAVGRPSPSLLTSACRPARRPAPNHALPALTPTLHRHHAQDGFRH